MSEEEHDTDHQGSSVRFREVSLLNPNLLFGTAWFWTLPEVQEVQWEIDALAIQFRRSIGMDGETR